MWPTLFTIAVRDIHVPVHSWGVALTLAFLVSAAVTQARAPSSGVDGDKLGGVYLASFVGGLLGARVLHFTMAEPGSLLRDPGILFRFWEGGFAFYGGVILATLACIAYARLRQIPFLKLADLTSPGIMLGLSIGRIGCFFAGCCHGRHHALPEGAVNLLPDSFSGGALYLVSQAPFLLEETHGGVGVRDLPLYPTQLWEHVGAMALFGILSWRWWHRRYDGQVFAWMLILYAILRSSIEMFRGDVVRGVDHLGFLSTSQAVSIPMLVVGVALVVLQRGRGVAVVEQKDRDKELLDEMLDER